MRFTNAVRAAAGTLLWLGLATHLARSEDVTVTVGTVPGGLSVEVDGADYTTPAVFVWASGSEHTLVAASPQLPPDAHSRYLYSTWNDGGAQTNHITLGASATNYTASFSTQYLLDLVVAPSQAGTVAADTAGPWHDSGQVVSLTAYTNTGYRFNFWTGVTDASNSTAQVTMDTYRRVQATFLPADYPYITVTNNGGTAPGSWIGSIDGRAADGTKLHYVILDNSGTNVVFADKTNTLQSFVTPQGFDAAAGVGSFKLKDETLAVVDSFATLGYTLDPHDIKLLPNGHVLLFADEVRTVDMSQLVPNGNTAASVTGNVIQELDADKRLVFEWHTFDHIPITDSFADVTRPSFDYAHINAVTIDPTDNQLLASLRTTSEIVKINRQTGEVIWRLGGKRNEFTIVGENSQNAPYYTVGQHDVHRLANGNLLFFDNGNISGGGITPNDRPYSRGVEYRLDEVNKIATLVWEFRHSPDISVACTGAIRRYPNGNRVINWGCAIPRSGTIVTEVSASGAVVFEMNHVTPPGNSPALLGNGLTKQLWNTPDLSRSNSYRGILSGQTYISAEAGVSVAVKSLDAAVTNELVVRRELDAVRFPQFAGKAPQVVMEHIVLAGTGINALSAELDLALPDSGYAFDTPVIRDPTQVVVYHRPNPGRGLFSELPGAWEPGARTLRVTATKLGEFIFAYPDLAETPFVPSLLSPADQSEVNEAQPVMLVWVPQGLVGSFDLQVASDAAFTNLVLDTQGVSNNHYAVAGLSPSTQYFWRVRSVNQGGTSDWASASFRTVPPVMQLTYPAGGEVWQRFQVVTIRWIDNISENVALDLYLDGVSNRTFVSSAPSSGAFSWTVGQFSALPHSTNYTIKIRSTTDPSLFALSQPFSIITNLTPVTIASVPSGLTVTVDGTNYTAPAFFRWLPTSSHTVEAPSPQVASDGQSRLLFAAWSDGGAAGHSVTVPLWAVTNTASFVTDSGVPLIDAASFVRLPDGAVRFSLTAGDGSASQATVWATTTLAPPDWQVSGIVPLSNGVGIFLEHPDPAAANRFYRVTLP